MQPVRKLRVAPATEEYLEEEERRDPLVRKVFAGLTWLLTHEQEPPGYKLPGYNPPKYIVTKSYRFPVPRLFRLIYQVNKREVFVELVQVVDYKEQENS
jgi:hypothetical protein